MFIILFVLLFVVLQIWQWLLICQWFAMMLTPMTFWLGNCAVLPNSNIALLIKPSRASSALKSANEQPTLRFVTEFPVSGWQDDFVKCFSPVHSAEEPWGSNQKNLDDMHYICALFVDIVAFPNCLPDFYVIDVLHHSKHVAFDVALKKDMKYGI